MENLGEFPGLLSDQGDRSTVPMTRKKARQVLRESTLTAPRPRPRRALHRRCAIADTLPLHTPSQHASAVIPVILIRVSLRDHPPAVHSWATLPCQCAPDGPTRTGGATALQATEPAGRRLLVVDDEHIERMLVARAVAPLGFTVDAAGSLEEAALLLGRHVYDAIVLDLALGETEWISLLPGSARRRDRPCGDLRFRHGRPGARRQRPAGGDARPARGRRPGQAGRPRRPARRCCAAPRNAPRRRSTRMRPSPSEAELALALAQGELAAVVPAEGRAAHRRRRSASRRWPAGTGRTARSCCPTCSSRWPRRAA